MALHHIHMRKRFSGETFHPYPATKKSIRILDKVVYVTGLLGLLTMLPQLHLIFIQKTASGIAPITWILLAIFNIPWIIYGLAHKEKPIIIIQSMWFVVNSLVFIGSVLY